MIVPAFLLVVALTGSIPKVLTIDGFTNLDDCRSAVQVADSLVQDRGPMSVLCINTKTWETVVRVSREQ